MVREETRGDRVLGGYVLISASDLCAAWAAYRTKRLRLYDLRVYLAAREMAARRCRLRRGRTPGYSLGEIHRLVGGVGGQHLRASLRRLEAGALLTLTESSIHFSPATVPAAGAAEPTGLHAAMLRIIPCAHRLVPVPRRVLRALAGGGRRVGIATAFAHLIRCVFRRGRTVTAGGRCAAGWVSKVFGVDERRVKAERKRLLDAGWLVAETGPVWARNRFGLRVRVNLRWSEARPGRGPSSTTGLPPRPPQSTTGLPPPESDKELLTDSNNQKPAPRGPAGAQGKRGGVATGRPSWRAVTDADLRDTVRLLDLHRQAVASGLVSAGEHARLQFAAAAEHARTVGTRNPAGLFVKLVRDKLCHFATQADEDAARARLRTGHSWPVRQCRPPPGGSGPMTAARACLETLLGGLGLTLQPTGSACRHNNPCSSLAADARGRNPGPSSRRAAPPGKPASPAG